MKSNKNMYQSKQSMIILILVIIFIFIFSIFDFNSKPNELMENEVKIEKEKPDIEVKLIPPINKKEVIPLKKSDPDLILFYKNRDEIKSELSDYEYFIKITKTRISVIQKKIKILKKECLNSCKSINLEYLIILKRDLKKELNCLKNALFTLNKIKRDLKIIEFIIMKYKKSRRINE